MPRGDGQRVLIVDDEEPLVRFTARALEELGYVASTFTSSAAALAAFRSDSESYDAVVTDERMPGTSGTELIRAVRDIRPTIPIMLVTGHVGRGRRSSRAGGRRRRGAQEAGVDYGSRDQSRADIARSWQSGDC